MLLTPLLFGLKPMPRHREVVLLKNNIFLKSFSVKMGGGEGVNVFEQKKT